MTITVDRLIAALRAARPNPDKPRDPDGPGPHGYAVIADGLYCDERGLGYLLGVSTRTLRNWREEGRGPKPAMFGRLVYDLEEVAAWMSKGGFSSEELGNARKS